MSHVDSGPLATYNSLQDKHLVGYFNNTRMRRHLRRSGLITRNGEIVTENTFRLNMARKEHQKHVRDLMAQAIVHKALDMERSRQAEIKRKLEEIAKVELVQRVKSSRGRKGDEDITPYLSPRAPSGRPKSAKQERPRSVVTGHRPSTAPSKRSGSAKKKSAIYVDKEGFPIHRDQAWGSSDDGTDEVDSHNLRELDPYALNDITVNMTPEEKQSNSPYKIDLTRDPRPPPRTPQGFKKSPRGTTRAVITRDGRRLRPKSNKGSLSLHRKEPAYPHPTQQQTLCDVTIRYRGNNLKLQYERQDKRDEIIINQQHCGGENLVVFHGLVEPGIDLVFTSRRHRGYPFSLTFFVNSIQVLRLSACCEYKYGPGVMLGGRKGHFKFGRVDGGSPCYRCMVEAELARRERQRYKDTQTEEPKPEPEPEPVLESQGTQSDPPPPDTRDQGEQAEGERQGVVQGVGRGRQSFHGQNRAKGLGNAPRLVKGTKGSKGQGGRDDNKGAGLKRGLLVCPRKTLMATASNTLKHSQEKKGGRSLSVTSRKISKVNRDDRQKESESGRLTFNKEIPQAYGGNGHSQGKSGKTSGCSNSLESNCTGDFTEGLSDVDSASNHQSQKDKADSENFIRDREQVKEGKVGGNDELDGERNQGQSIEESLRIQSDGEESDDAERQSLLYGSDTSVSEDLPSSFHYSS